ncbi:MAG: major capsid protein [Propionibacteriaceae bacterium]|nr:major capsid protein [Propionibacteriaceae bacterium]
MTLMNTQYKTPVELTGAAQAAASAFADSMPLTRWFTPNQNPTLNYEFDVNQLTGVDVATYRAFDTPAPYGKIGPSATMSGQLPPISRKVPIGEYTQLKFAGQMNMMGDKLVDYAAKLGVGVEARLEIARVQAVTEGKVILAENGISAEIDFGRDTGLTLPPLAGANMWTDPDSKPIDQLLEWIELVKVASRGAMPTAIMMSIAVMNAAATNQQMIEFAMGRNTDLPGRISTEQVKVVLAGYCGLTEAIVADEPYSTYDFGQPVWPQDTIVLLPPAGVLPLAGQGLGTTEYGVTAEAIQDEYGIPAGERSGIFSGAFDRHDPEGLDVLVSAVALPVMQKANTTLSAKVIPAS